MKSHTRLHKLRELLVLTLMGVLMYASQVIMAPLPNIELVSFLIILTVNQFGIKSLFPIYIFAGLEIWTYGIDVWSLCYLYVWTVFALAIFVVRKTDSRIIFTLISGIFGFLFGTLCAIPYFFIGGIGYGVVWIMNGIVFDLIHGFSNLLLTFLLYKPLSKVLQKAL